MIPQERGGAARPAAGMTAETAEALALRALAWVLSDDAHVRRFLALNGLAPAAIRRAPDDPGVLRGALDYLLGHEPDLIAFCDSAGLAPELPARARAALP